MGEGGRLVPQCQVCKEMVIPNRSSGCIVWLDRYLLPELAAISGGPIHPSNCQHVLRVVSPLMLCGHCSYNLAGKSYSAGPATCTSNWPSCMPAGSRLPCERRRWDTAIHGLSTRS